MDERHTYSKLVKICFSMTAGDVFDLLRKAGKIPEGMSLDCREPEDTDWPITLKVTYEAPDTPPPIAKVCVCEPPKADGYSVQMSAPNPKCPLHGGLLYQNASELPQEAQS